MGRRVRVAAATIVVLTACAVIDFGVPPMVPGTLWQVVAVDGQGMDGSQVIVQFHGHDKVGLSSACGAVAGEVVMDTDGRAVSFSRFERVPPGACTEADMFSHQLVAGALQLVERWEPAENDAIDLVGEQTVRIVPRKVTPPSRDSDE